MPKLQEIKTRLANITKGRWVYLPESDHIDGSVNCGEKHIALCNYFNSHEKEKRVTREDQHNNSIFISNAPADIDWLVQEVERLHKHEVFVNELLELLGHSSIDDIDAKDIAEAMKWCENYR